MYKVCHISDALPGTHKSWGGAEQACLRLIEASNRNGIDVSVITTKPDTAIFPSGAKFFISETLDSYVNPALIKKLSLKHLGFDPVAFFQVYRTLKKISPDVVHVHRIVFLTTAAVAAARLLRIPVVASIYDYFYFCPKETLTRKNGERCTGRHEKNCAACMELEPLHGFLKMPFIKIRGRLFDYFLRDAVFHVLSRSSRSILMDCEVDAGRIYRILQIFPLKNQKKASEIKQGLILYVGWVQERKGLHILLEAMPEIIKECPKAYLVAIGEINKDAYFDRIQALIRDNSLEDRISLVGRKDYSVVTEYMNEANVVAIPEQWENMSPVVLIEAMSYGKAVVASNIGGIPEYMIDQETGLLANAAAPGDFSSGIISIINNKDAAIRLGAKARQHILQLMNEEKIMGEYKAMYEMMAGGENA